MIAMVSGEPQATIVMIIADDESTVANRYIFQVSAQASTEPLDHLLHYFHSSSCHFQSLNQMIASAAAPLRFLYNRGQCLQSRRRVQDH